MSLSTKAVYSIDNLERKSNQLQQQLVDRPEGVDLSRVSAELDFVNKQLDLARRLEDLKRQYQEAEEMLASEDADMQELARQEAQTLIKEIQELDQQIITQQLEYKLRDPNDDRAVILEIRAGAGGDEASLFAFDLFRMYSQYAKSQGWDINLIDASISEAGGYKEVVAKIEGKNAYKQLKYESGVHRVQRIPVTESSGRIHTSTASVAVLPEAKEIDIKIEPKDLRIDVMRATGAGGQCVNTTDSAVRITHLPTGIVVSCQETKHQQQNKEKAMTILRSRLYEKKRQEEQEKRSNLRASQIGSAMRSEKIRTYNFPQSRITDHRIKKSWHNLEDVLNGNIQGILDEVSKEMQLQQLKALEKEESNEQAR